MKEGQLNICKAKAGEQTELTHKPETRHHRWYECPAVRQSREQVVASLGETCKKILRETLELGEGSPLFDNALAAPWAHLAPPR